MTTERIINLLKEKQLTHAITSTLCPQGNDAFSYGKACGIVQGLEMAMGLILDGDKQEKGMEANSNG